MVVVENREESERARPHRRQHQQSRGGAAARRDASQQSVLSNPEKSGNSALPIRLVIPHSIAIVPANKMGGKENFEIFSSQDFC